MEWYYSRRRKDIDIKKFLNDKKGIEVMLIDYKYDLFEVVYHGPEDSFYKDGIWRIHVHIPFNYPNKPPLLFFLDKIFHPNIPEPVRRCMDVPSEAWRETYDIGYMFEQFLPQLLRHPNPSPILYSLKVKSFVLFDALRPKHQFLALSRSEYSSFLPSKPQKPLSYCFLASFISWVSLNSLTLYELRSMKGEGMAKRSIGSLMRKKLSDITNSQPQPQLPSIEENLPENFAANKECIEQLLKERVTDLMNLS